MKYLLISFLVSIHCLISFDAKGQQELMVKLDFKMEDETLTDALFELSEISRIPISFSNNNLDERKYSYEFHQKSLKYILKQILSDQNLDFTLINDKILVFKKKNLLTLSGYIEDSESGESLIGANIYRSDEFGGTVSNDYGFFSITVPEDDILLNISYLGYKPKVIHISKLKSKNLRINLEQNLTFEEIVITDKIKNSEGNYFKEEIDGNIVQNTTISPALGGEPDIIRQLTLLPSVQTGPDGFGGIFVRGGNADQNLVLLDGVPIYNPYHALGIFSVFDHNMVHNVKFHHGSFPARYGGRVSSVVDVRTKEGNNKKFQLDGNIGLLASKISLQGPIVKDKAAFIVSARRTHLDPFLKFLPQNNVFNADEGNLNYLFGDIIAKVNYKINPKNRIFASFYKGRDAFKNSSTDTYTDFEGESSITQGQGLDWGNTLAVGRWNHTFNNQVFTNLTLTYSEFEFKSEERLAYDFIIGYDRVQFSSATFFNSKITNSSIKYDLDYIFSNDHYVRAGIQVSTNSFQPGITNFRDSAIFLSAEILADTLNVPTTQTVEFNSYLEDEWKINKNWRINAGFYNSVFSVRDKLYWRVDPRIYSEYELNNKILFSASFNILHQNLHLLSRSGSGFPNDLWIPSTDKIKPQQTKILNVGLSWNVTDRLKFSSEAYYKNMKNLVFFQENAAFGTSFGISATNWEDRVVNGKGTSKGIELSTSYEYKKFNSWIHYTLSDTERLFPDLNGGKPFPFKYDNRHKINLGFLYNISPKWSFTANWNFSSGSNITLQKSTWLYVSQSNFLFNEEIDFIDFSDINEYQLPAYHRLDVSLKYIHLGKNSTWSIDIGCYNSYNRKNPLYIRPKFDLQTETIKYKQIVLIPVLPYFNLSIRL